MTVPSEVFKQAVTLHQAGQSAPAIAAYQQVLAAEPGHAGALGNLGGLLFSQGREAEGLALLDRAAMVARRQQGIAQFNLGHALVAAGKLEDAAAALRLAAQADPDSAEIQCLLGATLEQLACWDEALICHSKATVLAPLSDTARFNLGVALLRRGEFGAGWRYYQARLTADNSAIRIGERRFQCPEWDGSPLAGSTILVHGEQGLGDNLQFVRFLRDLKDRGARVVLACQADLARLFAALPWIDEILSPPPGELRLDLSAVQAHWHVPLLSLPYKLGLETIPLLAAPYISAIPATPVLQGAKLKVGLVWRGNPGHSDDRSRSLAPEMLAPLLTVPGITFFSLQKDAPAEEVARLGGTVTHLGGMLDDMTHTAALVAQLDLVVTVDTAMAHLAGAMGKPVWILLPFLPDWRWLLRGDTTPWYPSARLFRQQRHGEWGGALAQLRRALAGPVPRLLLYCISKSRCGVGVWTHALALGLRRHGFEVVVARPPEPDCDSLRAEQLAGIRHQTFDYSPESDPSRFAQDATMARRLLDAAAPSLALFINGDNPWLCFAAAAEAEALAVPYVISDHLLHRDLLTGGKAENMPLRQRYLSARAVTTVSQDNLAVLRDVLDLPSDYGQAVVNSCADRFFAPVDDTRRRALRHRFSIPDDAVACLTVAKLETVKGHAAQLPALARLMAENSKLHAIWLGEGPLRDSLRSAVTAAGLSGRIHFPGHSEDVTPWLDAADIFLLTSHAEGMPLSVIEAMAKGLPVLASDVGGVAQAVGDAGIVLPAPGNESELTGRLTEALAVLTTDVASRRGWGARGRTRAEALFREDRMVREYVAVIEAALSPS